MTGVKERFSKNLTFKQQLIFAFSAGIVLLALATSLLISTFSSEALYKQFLEEGRYISNAFTQQSVLALLYDSEENASDAAQSISAFPDVVSIEIYRQNQTLLYRSKTKEIELTEVTNWPLQTSHVTENELGWSIVSPVFSVSSSDSESPFAEKSKREKVGYTRIFITKATVDAVVDKIFTNNLLVSLGLAVVLLGLLLLITNNIVRPINHLSTIMEQSGQAHEKKRADLEGSRDIIKMKNAFNAMMDELEAREAELTRARDSAIGAAHAKGQFATSVSHELRTPMNGILGMLDLLKSSGVNDQQKEYLKVARNSGLALLALIDDILDFSKFGSGKMRLDKSAFEFKELMEEIRDLLSVQSKRKNIELNLIVDDQIPEFLIADAGRVRQVLLNLIGNGIKFTEKGSVSFTAELDTSDIQDMIKIRVCDTGIGIPESAQNKIFEAFSQADNSTTRKYGGTGLGLTISKQLVELMGGQMGLISTVGEGSEFWFTFPLEKADSKDASNEKSLTELSPYQFLLVSDDANEFDRLQKLFESWGAGVVTSRKGRTALVASNAALAKHQPFDCIVICPPINDIDLYQLCQDFRHADDDNSSKIAVMSKAELKEETLSALDINIIVNFANDKLLFNYFRHLLIPSTEALNVSSNSQRMSVRSGSDSHHNILIAEDNRANQLVALGMMERLGHSADVAENGAIALRMIERKQYDLILMDCNMPELDGFMATESIRQLSDPKLSKIPILAMTALTGIENRRRCLDAGMDDYLVKPIELDELGEKLKVWLQHAREHEDISKEKAGEKLLEAASKTDQQTGPAIINKEKLESVKKNLGTTFDIVVITAMEDTPEYLRELRKAIDQKDIESFKNYTQKIKGTALNLCADSLANSCDTLENIESFDQAETVDALFQTVDAEFQRLKEALHSQAEAEQKNLPGRAHSILVVDSEASSRFALQGILSRDGYSIISAENGAEAIKLCIKDMPDLILMDVMIGERDGFSVCEEILQIDDKFQPVILLITPLDDEKSVEKAFNAGASDIIPKPVNLVVVRKRVQHFLTSKSAEHNVHKLAYFDSLTNLPNRTLFIDRATEAFRRATQNEKKIAVITLDLDRFKYINDTQGHHVGDLLLKTAAQRLKGCLRNADIIARLSGDEFVIFLDDIEGIENIEKVAEKLSKKFDQPFSFMDQQVRVSLSMGISESNENHNDVYSLMKQSEAALKQAKSKGGSCFQFYEQGMETEIMKRIALENELRQAIAKDELFLHYQPQLDLRTNTVNGAEALVRWQHPTRGMLPPIEFITLAEESGLIHPLGEWLIHRTCRQINEWKAEGKPIVPIAINISSQQIESGDLFEKTIKILDEEKVPHDLIKLEITENSLVNIDDNIVGQLQKFKDHGLLLAIDDFGTGYSSLSYLKQLPVSTLKIDRAFIKDMTEGSSDESIVASVIRLGHSLRLNIVAEGVETKEQEELLRKHNCDVTQGYYFSRPLPADAFGNWLTKHEES